MTASENNPNHSNATYLTYTSITFVTIFILFAGLFYFAYEHDRNLPADLRTISDLIRKCPSAKDKILLSKTVITYGDAKALENPCLVADFDIKNGADGLKNNRNS